MIEPITLKEPNLYELLGRKEVIIQSLMMEIARLTNLYNGLSASLAPPIKDENQS